METRMKKKSTKKRREKTLRDVANGKASLEWLCSEITKLRRWSNSQSVGHAPLPTRKG